jgi:NAD(P)-dependent dehydrogenase (short-subunit alcohol dehydrogenase family)
MAWTLVTGGARRLGAEICTTLAEKGHPVLIHFNQSEAEAEQLVRQCHLKGVEAASIHGDFSTIESTEAFVEDCRQRFLPIKHLINNVGNYLVKSALETTIEECAALFQTNLYVPFILSQAFLPTIKSHRGTIINLGTTGIGAINANAQFTVYRMTKMSLYMLTKSLAKELAPFQVRVNMVSPGYLENAVDLPAILPKLSMQRPGFSREIARVIAFLMEEESGYITGQNIEIAGGVAL